jgi:hypothetical protein
VELDSEDDDDNYIAVHLAENDKKSFNKFILDTFSEIQHFYKYSVILEDGLGEGEQYELVTESVEKVKKYGLTMEEYMKRIKGSCTKNGCEDLMLSCLKNIQYFEKSEWKKLEQFLEQDISGVKIRNDPESLKKQLEEKEKELKNLKKENMELKTGMVSMIGNSKIEPQKNNNVSKLDMSLFELNPVE